MDIGLNPTDEVLGLRVVREVGLAIADGAPVEDVADLLVRPLGEHLGADGGHAFLVDGVTGAPQVLAVWPGSTDAALDAAAVGVLGDPLSLPVEPVWTEHGDGACRLVVPVRTGSPTIGALELHGADLRRPEEALLEALGIACGMIANLALRLEAERRAAVAEVAIRPAPDPGPAVTYIDALAGPNTTLYISPQVTELLGYSEREWVETPGLWEQLLHPEDRERVLTQDRRSFEERTFVSEYRLVARDGTVRWFRDEAVVVEEDGRPMFWRGSLIEISDRKEAEIHLREAETRYRVLVEHIPAIVYVEEAVGGVVPYMSPQVERITGFTPEERREDPGLWAARVHPDDLERFLVADARSTELEEPFVLEYRFFAKDGREIWLHDECAPIRGEEGELRYWQGVVLDVTELKRTEAERARLLAHLVKAQEEERARIAGDIHDDPIQKMTAVGLRLQMLRAHVSGDDGAAALARLEETVQETVRRMRSLLFELRPPALDRNGLAAALGECLDQARVDGGFVYDMEDQLVDDLSDETRTIAYRIGQEVITNARKHAQAGHVHVSLSNQEDGVLVRISDDGIGFDPELSGGTGPGHLGIPGMHERAELAAGWLRIDSASGVGTTVQFWLPRRNG